MYYIPQALCMYYNPPPPSRQMCPALAYGKEDCCMSTLGSTHAKDGSGSRLIVATSSVVPLGPTSLVPSHSLPWQMEKHRMCRSAAM